MKKRQILGFSVTALIKNSHFINKFILCVQKFNWEAPASKWTRRHDFLVRALCKNIQKKNQKNHPHWFYSELSEDSKTVSGVSVRPLLSSQWFFKVDGRSTEISYFRAQLSITNYRSRIKYWQNTLLRLVKLFKFYKTIWKRFQTNIKIQNYTWKPFCLRDISTRE